jgi:hypothetical protein
LTATGTETTGTLQELDGVPAVVDDAGQVNVIDWPMTVLGAATATINATDDSPIADRWESLPLSKLICENSPVLGESSG